MRTYQPVKNLNILIYCFMWGLLVFMYGFFPGFQLKVHDLDDINPHNLNTSREHKVNANINRTILIIIDALRYDFATVNNMPFALENSCGKVKLRTDTPTVTMPRIKSLITGGLSNFIDIVLNLGYIDQLHDSLLHRLTKAGRKVIFTGDNVWEKLFPNLFHRSYAVANSFYVNDFFEGDKEVTKVINNELHRFDWDFLIAHYLGLDHIGHVEGTSSIKIPIKLLEMDDVFRSINSQVGSQFVLVTADHGMRDAGGHGGGSPEEIYVPLLYFMKNCRKLNYTPEYNQIDLVPTLSVLLDIDVPESCIGCIIPELIDSMPENDQLNGFFHNARHLIRKTHKIYGDQLDLLRDMNKRFKQSKSAQEMTKKLNPKHSLYGYFYEKAKRGYIDICQALSRLLSNSFSTGDHKLIFVALALTSCIALYILLCFIRQEQHIDGIDIKLRYVIAILVAALVLHFTTSFLVKDTQINWLVLFTITLAAYFLWCTSRWMHINSYKFVLSLQRAKKFPLLPSICTIIVCVSLFSSSYIEEEHFTWFYLTSTLLLVYLVKVIYHKLCLAACNYKAITFSSLVQELYELRKMLLVLLLLALVKKLNRTGEKWRNSKALYDVLNKDEYQMWLLLTFCIGYFIVALKLQKLVSKTQSAFVVLNVIMILFKNINEIFTVPQLETISNFVPLVSGVGLCVMIVIGCTNALLSQKELAANGLLKTMLMAIMLIALLLHKPHNVLLLGILLFTLDTVLQFLENYSWAFTGSTRYRMNVKALMANFIAKTFFYCQGNTNNLATIDVNAGFVGQKDFNLFTAIIFVTINTYNSEIIAFLSIIVHELSKLKISIRRHSVLENCESSNQLKRNLLHILLSYATVVVTPTALYLYILVYFENHIFIYSVFAPKLLYESFKVLLYLLQITVVSICITFI